MQLANTPLLQSTTPGLHPVSIYQTSLPVRGSKHPITAYYSIYPHRKDESLSWPSWLTCSGRFTHVSGHPSAASRAQDRESSPAEYRRCTTVPRHQLTPQWQRKFTTKWSLYRMSSFHFTVGINLNSFPWWPVQYSPYTERTPKFFGYVGCGDARHGTMR